MSTSKPGRFLPQLGKGSVRLVSFRRRFAEVAEVAAGRKREIEGMAQQIVPFAVVLGAAVMAAVTDLWKFKIHNALTLPLFVTGLLYHMCVDEYWALGLFNSLVGGAVGFLILGLFYVMGGMGAGDVKLVAAVGAWLGVHLTLYVFIASSLAAGCYALFLILFYGRFRETLVNFQILWHRLTVLSRHVGAEDLVEQEVNRADRRRRIIPFAAMVALGLLAVLAFTYWKGLP